MAIKDAADFLLKIMGEIRFYWNFYVVTLIALIGWLLSNKNSLSNSLKFLITTGYLIFVAMNILGLYSSYTLAEAIRLDLLAMEDAKIMSHTYDVLQATSLLAQRTASLVIHLVLGIVFLSAVWFGPFGERSAKSNRSSTARAHRIHT